MAEATILDPCCGGRMMWFDRQDQRALFGDIRSEEHTLCDGRAFNITPDLNMDFRAIPFAADTFSLVVFDPPHLRRAGRDSWLRAKYGILGDDWQDDLRRGLAECFRVLKPAGVLIFKWAEVQIPVSQVLALTDHRPLFGHKSGKREKTHWLTFMKPADTDNKEM
ncbi:SAM-dependent methyltransferase [Achromobacter ruhlandii]|uniref:SAM-dependent methyltransferase n=1 Tax=Achromobacter ruhlandii TaxID=72557 RepID=UPI003BA200A9